MSKILNFHVFLKKLQNSRLTHAYFYCFRSNNLKKMQKVKCHALKKNNSQKIPNKRKKLMSKTNKIITFPVFLKKNPKRKTRNMRISIFFLIFCKNTQNVKCNHFTNIHYHFFQNNSKISI